MKPAIEISGLSKSYTISHQQKAEYQSLRDEISRFFTKPISLITGNETESEQFWALKNINFEVNPGEVVGIIGRNGSGKSTLLKTLSRIIDPTSGKAIMRGKVASLLEVGTGFHPELTGRENIYFNGSILGMTKKEIEKKFADIVEFAEIEKFLDTPVKFYSSGMYVRLAFAVAAHLEPDILIIDEVLAVGDAQFQKKSLGKMKNVAGEGRTVLFVSHSMDSIRQLCSRAILLENGMIKTSGDVNKVTNDYIGRHFNEKSVHEFDPKGLPRGGFSRIMIMDHQGKTSARLKPNAPWSLEIEYEIKEVMNKAVMIIEIRTSENETIYMTTDSDLLDEPKTKHPGRYKASIIFDQFFLNPGHYSIRTSLQVPGQTIYDIVEDIDITVEIDPDSVKGKLFAGKYFGYISNNAKWEIKSLSTNRRIK